MAAEVQKRKLSRGKKILFGLIILMGLYIFVEFVTFCVLSVRYRELGTWSVWQTERDQEYQLETLVLRNPRMLHPYLGFLFQPGGSLGSSFSINDHGFLQKGSPIRKKSDDTLIVAVVGGSVALQMTQKAGKTLKETMRRSERFADKEIVLLNLATYGHKQPQQLMVLVYLLSLGAEFDVLVNLDGFNEVALHESENGASGVFPAFPRSWYTLLHGTLTGLEYRKLSQDQARLAKAYSQAPWRWSAVSQVVWKFKNRQIEETRQQLEQDLVSHSDATPLAVVKGPSLELKEDQTVYHFLTEVWQRSSLQMASICEANQIKYYHFVQPNQYDPGSKQLSDKEREIAFVEDHIYRDGVIRGYPMLRRLGKELQARGVKFFDLTQLFVEQKNTIYDDACCHYNQEGNELLASRIGDLIVEDLQAKEE